MTERYSLVQLRNGTHSVRSLAEDETFHPGIGPVAEAEALYVRQLDLSRRVMEVAGEFVIWDIGLGAAANALTAVTALRDSIQAPRRVRIVSFDLTTEALAFARRHVVELPYLAGFESAVDELIHHREVQINAGSVAVRWTLILSDLPEWLRSSPVEPMAPRAIFFDPHSPRKNPALWTVPFFRDLFARLDPEKPCVLANFTRSTLARAALLLGGFFVGVGHAAGMKEETTVASNRVELISEPLDQRWLERAQRSDSAEPLWTPVYRQAPLSPETLRQLLKHPQFRR